jgi:hypothetical protein
MNAGLDIFIRTLTEKRREDEKHAKRMFQLRSDG